MNFYLHTVPASGHNNHMHRSARSEVLNIPPMPFARPVNSRVKRLSLDEQLEGEQPVIGFCLGGIAWNQLNESPLIRIFVTANPASGGYAIPLKCSLSYSVLE